MRLEPSSYNIVIPQTPVDAGVIGGGLKVSVGKKKHRMVQIG